MSDYIKRSDALNFDLEIECEPDDLQPMMEGMARVMDYIKQIPAADVESARKGTWVLENGSPLNHEPKMLECFFCDQCGELAPGYPFWECHLEPTNYCPNCGAKMQSSADSSETRTNRVDGGNPDA